MRLEIVTPDTTLFEGDHVHLVQLPGIDGSFEVMNHHASLISVLKKGSVKVEINGEEPKFFEINGGVIEVLKNKVLILAE
ncbi:MAG: F0F1 ATP synthase subunit epsilon [Bacteroidales bacterium]|nr:F0F1 ATP synthase subunit epsilon [Bacteroidales bacterium]